MRQNCANIGPPARATLETLADTLTEAQTSERKSRPLWPTLSFDPRRR